MAKPLPQPFDKQNVVAENRRARFDYFVEEAFDAGVGEEQAFDTVLPWLSEERCAALAGECLELYCWDRLGSEN